MGFAFVGLAFSHPKSFAKILTDWGERVTWVWDEDLEKAQEFSQAFGAQMAAELEAIPLDGLEAVFLGGIASHRPSHARRFLAAGVPVFADKPLAPNEEGLRAWQRLRREFPQAQIFGASALSFSPCVQELQKKAEQLGPIYAAESVIAHSVALYQTPPHTWQDDPAQGGGTLINMGIHGVEPILKLIRAPLERVYARGSKLAYPQGQSEDTAMIQLEFADGRLATIQVLGGTKAHGYHFGVHGPWGSLRTQAPSPSLASLDGQAMGLADPFLDWGYLGIVKRFLQGVRHGGLTPWAELERVARVMLAIRRSATLAEPVRLR